MECHYHIVPKLDLYFKEEEDEEDEEAERPAFRPVPARMESAVDITEKFVFELLKQPRYFPIYFD